ncbi:uncharacterized protein PHACADRAFT_263859 [Phanerochaete carnosa HHB-10118-sp]|uniref:RING-type E3 ubiquitin transferase n=1 Tax=Phanerochaete carnosa (strain HHB-10118-sp) TaxID=650164 RepID=K5VUN1_PHACS|nr:uncharacterized protein PHACADRAFT_263859 [Phanerochaete carnosa HHB-10118-sp]EKM50520.1 hypothetical protein PHACADRAFT_263859 [Phanerochaete carnosa HHB-10118-sp]
MQDEQDTCRICSAPAEPDQPLYHPCKCSGTIRYIHQDCLTTWLAHSKKKSCDVCKHPYSFTKVYSLEMPSRLPVALLLRRLAQQSVTVLLFVARAVMVALIWLALLPWATIWTWRVYFALGDSTAWWISSRPRPPQTTPVSENRTFVATHTNLNDTTSWPISLLSHPVIVSVSADIVSGQIIATVIVVAFVAVFLLREWISQNARPGIFDDAEGPPELQDAELPPPALAAGEAAPGEADPEEADLGEAERLAVEAPLPPTIAALDHETRNQLNKIAEDLRAKAAEIEARRAELRTELQAKTLERRRRRRSWDEQCTTSSTSAVAGDSETSAFDFDPAASNDEEEALVRQAPADFKMDFSGWTPLDWSHIDADGSSPLAEIPSAVSEASSAPQTPSRQRPPLFSTAILPDRDSLSPSPMSTSSRGRTPLASPSLATYRAPEELEAGPSKSLEYFPQHQREEEFSPNGGSGSTEREYDTYFRDPEAKEDNTLGKGKAPAVQAAPLHARQDSESDHDMPGLAQITDAESDDGEELEEERHAQANIPDPEPFNPFDAEDEAVEGDDEQLMDIREALAEPRQEFPDPEEGDVGMEDDMEGALEAIGLRGPIFAVLQNAALMIFVLNATIGIGIWLPFIVGKSLALLSLDPKRLLYIIHFPIRAIRIITDPVVDSFMFVLSRLMAPLLWRAVGPCLSFIKDFMSNILGQQTTDKGIETFSVMLNRTAEAVTRSFATLLSASDTPVVTQPTLVDRLLAPDSAFMRLAEPYFAPIGETLRLTWEDLKTSWVRLALGNGTTEKIFAVSLGYMVNAVLLALYLNVVTTGNMKNAGRAMRSAIRQQLLVVKVAAFIIIELVVFPLGCGIMLDICTVSLFPQGSLRTRLVFLAHAPLTSAFYHWVIGTMFMYQFAVLLAAFRTCLRPGALWFIKDPQDQNFHPIREILDRPALVHVRKLLISGIMYGFVIACSVGTVSAILRVFSRTIMPFRWKLREPLSVVPIDLLFLHLVLPYTLQYFRPRKFLKQNSLRVWKFIAKQLRLSSYLFGGRHPDEELSNPQLPLADEQKQPATVIGTFRRVPNTDNVALAKGQAATAEVDEEGRPVSDKEARLMLLQDTEAENNKRNIKDDYVIAYMPPHFRYRACTFVAAVWIFCSVFLASALAIPILLGRGFFRLFLSYDVHDGYSFVAGFYLLWTCWLVSNAINRMDRHRQRRGGDQQRADLALYFIKRSLLWGAKAAYMALCLGFVIPTLIAIVVELYVILPVRHEFQPETQPRIRIVDMWALGLLYTKVLLRVQRMQPMGTIARGVQSIRRNGWTHPDPVKATKEVIAPLTVGLLGMILLPPAVVWVGLKATGLQMNEKLLYLHIYPGICTLTAACLAAVASYDVISSWSQTVRDKEFLVEMRLQNLDPGQEAQGENDTTEDGPIEDDAEDF